MKAKSKILWICSTGGVLEFYDFAVYALMASILAKNFFPMQDSLVSLLATFATFSLGYLVRPLGGLLFGHFGDRYGRKRPLMLSVLLMAACTFAIGFVPNYGQWGVMAPVVLTLLRVGQGLCVGGEIPGALTFIAETFPNQPYRVCAFVLAGVTCGLVLGSLLVALLLQLLSNQQVMSWGWRLLFYLGGLFGIISYFLRRYLEETQLYTAMANKAGVIPMLAVFKQYKCNTLVGVLLVGFAGGLTVLYFLFSSTYVADILHYPLGHYLWFKSAATLLSALVCAAVGALSQRRASVLSLQIIVLVGALFTMLIFYLLVYHYDLSWLALLLMGLVSGVVFGRLPGLLVSLFPTEMRYTGVALTYNVGFGLLAGITPLVATSLVGWTGQLLSPVYYSIAIAVCALAVIFLMRPVKL